MNIKIGMIGAGNMGGAILQSVKGKICPVGNIYIYDPTPDVLDKFTGTGINICGGNTQVAENSDYLFLAIKPQNYPDVISEIKGSINHETVIVSIAAGIGEDYLIKAFGFTPKLVLVMPNTPLLIGCGATALSKAGAVNDSEFEVVRGIFNSCGMTAEMDKNSMNAVIAINGSSPAFIYLFAKGFVQYAKSVNINEESALKLFCASLTGAAKMMTESGYSIDRLIEMVSSPGGTTIEGLKEFNQAGLVDIVIKACESTNRRAEELGLKD